MSRVTITEKPSSSNSSKKSNGKRKRNRSKKRNNNTASQSISITTNSPKPISNSISRTIVEDIPKPIREPTLMKKEITHHVGLKDNYAVSVTMPYRAKMPSKVPSSFAGDTYSFRTNIRRPIQVLGAGKTTPNSYAYAGAANFTPGTFIIKGNRSLAHPLSYLAETQVAYSNTGTSNGNSITSSAKQQGTNEGLFDVLGLNVVGVGECLQAPPGKTLNLVAPINVPTNTGIDMPVFPFKNVDQNGNVFYGHSLMFTPVNSQTPGGGITVSFSVMVGTNNAGGNSINVSLVDRSGVLVTNNVAVPPASGNNGYATLQTFFGATTLGQTPSNGDYRGDRMLGIQMATAGYASDLTVSNFQIQYSFSPGIYDQLTWLPLNFDDSMSAFKAMTRFRVVGQSFWSQYTGGKGFNATGGSISATVYEGGNSILYAGNDEGSLLWTTQGIRSIPNSFNGPVDQGCYGWTYPQDFSAQNFITLGSHDPYKDVQFMIVGSINPPSNGGVIPQNLIMLKSTLIYEAVTVCPWLSTTPSVVNPTAATKTARVLNKLHHSYGSVMSNDTHEDILKYATVPADVINYYAKSLGPLANQLLGMAAIGSFI